MKKHILLLALAVLLIASFTTACNSTSEPPINGDTSSPNQQQSPPSDTQNPSEQNQSPSQQQNTPSGQQQDPNPAVSSITINGVEYSTDLTELVIKFLEDKDVTDLKEMKNLTKLDLSANYITDLSFLTNLKSLTWLDLGSGEFSDISPLAELTNLVELRLYNNKITDISPLAGLTKLDQLALDSNEITDISALSGLSNLTDLDLDDNKIRNLTPLSGLKNLEYLWLGNNPITDWSPVDHIDFVVGRPLPGQPQTPLSTDNFAGTVWELESLEMEGTIIPLAELGMEVEFYFSFLEDYQVMVTSNGDSDIAYYSVSGNIITVYDLESTVNLTLLREGDTMHLFAEQFGEEGGILIFKRQ